VANLSRVIFQKKNPMLDKLNDPDSIGFTGNRTRTHRIFAGFLFGAPDIGAVGQRHSRSRSND
jgi:hypothetical protein